MDISIRGTKGLGTAAIKIVWRDAAMVVLRATEYLAEVADADTLEAAYYAAGVTPPDGAISFDIIVSSTGRVWSTGLVADYLAPPDTASITSAVWGSAIRTLSAFDFPATVPRQAGDYPTAITYSGTYLAAVTWNSGKVWTYHYNTASQLTGITEV